LTSAQKAQAGPISDKTIIMSEGEFNKRLQNIENTKNNTGHEVKTKVANNQVVIAGLGEQIEKTKTEPKAGAVQGAGKSNNSIDLSILSDPQALAKMDSFERADYFARAYVSTDDKLIKTVAFTQSVLNFPAKLLEAYSASLKFAANNSMQGGYNNPEITDIMVDTYVYGMIPGEAAGGLVSSLRGVSGLTSSAEGAAKTIKVGELDSLPSNAKNMYNKYDSSGWKGSVSGQTPGTAAGSKYLNRDAKLPTTDSAGNSITYKEFDVNNKLPDAGRDAQRFVRGSDGSVYYTNDHYGTFTQIK
jgi:guanyl-specific ribonuclease Sa